MNYENLISILEEAKETINRSIDSEADEYWSKFILPRGADADALYREKYAKDDVALMERIDQAINDINNHMEDELYH